MTITTNALTSGNQAYNSASFTTASVVSTGNRLQLLQICFHTASAVAATPALTITDSELSWDLVDSEMTFESVGNFFIHTVVYRALPSTTTAARTVGVTSAGTAGVEWTWSWTEKIDVDTSGTNGAGAIVQTATARGAFGIDYTITSTLTAFGSTDNATVAVLGCGYENAETITIPSGCTLEHEIKGVYTHVVSAWRNDNDTSVEFTTDLSQHMAMVAIELKAATTGDVDVNATTDEFTLTEYDATVDTGVAALTLAPVIYFTDIITGPNSGGENNNGTYLSIFGRNFGSDLEAITVTINDIEVADYKYLGDPIGCRPGDQQLSVQVGAVTTGAVKVTIGGVDSNTDHIFTVVAGNIHYVALTGSDGAAGTYAAPWRNIQNSITGVNGTFAAGDHCVVRGGTWTDVEGLYGSFFRARIGGTISAPIAIIGYPGETPLFEAQSSPTPNVRGISVYLNISGTGYTTIAGFAIDGKGQAQPAGEGWHGTAFDSGVSYPGIRLCNNNVTGFWEDSGGASCFGASNPDLKILGNHAWVNAGSKLYHACYLDARGEMHDAEVAYNHFERQYGGRGIQCYGDTGTFIYNIKIHHNLVHDIHLDGIQTSRDCTTGFEIYNNIVYQCGDDAYVTAVGDPGSGGSCIRITGLMGIGGTVHIAKVYNNICWDGSADGGDYAGALSFEYAEQLYLRNNICGGVLDRYVYIDSGFNTTTMLTSENNLWYGVGGVPSWDVNGVNADPLFTNESARDYTLQSTSPAIEAGTVAVSDIIVDDYLGTPRPQDTNYDIGAYEFFEASSDINVNATTDVLTLVEYPATVDAPIVINATTDILTLVEYPAVVTITTSAAKPMYYYAQQ